MALESIEPEYQKWIGSINQDNIYTKFIVLENKFNLILKDVLYTSVPDKELLRRTNEVRKEFLYIEIVKNLMSVKEQEITSETELVEGIKNMRDNLKLIDSYESRNDMIGQKKALDILTLISLIFLPIGVIVGYFGMNFGSMGNPIGNNPGILNVKYGQILVFFLFFLSIGITLIIITRFYKFKF